MGEKPEAAESNVGFRLAPIPAVRIATIVWLKSTLPAIGGSSGRSAWRPRLIVRWAPFDNAEGRLAGRERNVVGHYRLRETLQAERANLFGCDAPF
jgi:hypothetical protein